MTKEKKVGIELVEIPTQLGLAYKDNDTEKIFRQEELLVEIANDIKEIRKSVVGK